MPLLSFSFFCYVFFITISQAKAGDPVSCDNDRGNYTANSTYDNNLKTLLSTFSSHTEINYGFYNFSYGQDPDKAYAIGLCRGDIEPNQCLTDINNSFAYLKEQCPNQKEAIVWADELTLWYSDRSIFGIVDTDLTIYLDFEFERNSTDVDAYSDALSKLMRKLKDKAASGDTRRKYDAGNRIDPVKNESIYGFVQCVPDLPSQQCDHCLEEAISKIPYCCNGKMRGNIFRSNCRLRYEPYLFYNSTIVLDSLPTTNNTSLGEHSKTRIIIATVVPGVTVVLVLIFICIYLRLRKPKQNFEAYIGKYDDGDEEAMTNVESLRFSFNFILLATNGFSNSNKLGQGGFGVVYLGKLPTGHMVAVKRLSTNSAQGDEEFKNEVLLVAKLQHRNLVRLQGFTLEGRERLLIYEYVANKSLDFFIFDSTRKTQLNWEKRYNIIKGIARGLLYLHEDSRLRIIHRDLKASNILLDDDMNPKISDFGLARLCIKGETQGSTNRIVGTYGYMAPEYVMYGEFSVKSDVFSFGILVLEIITGHKNSASICHGENMEYLLSYAWRSWIEGNATNIIDPSLNNISQNEIMRCIHIGLLCIQENIVDRPTMATVAHMLNSYSLTLSIPSKPAYFMGSGPKKLPDMEPLVADAAATRFDESINQVSITEPYPR
ncbi:cysteine-rich receptor-like protein kinase 44 [Vicia villosa]|uniref:cysteine-rich receptor-like protein kinase 44 n=1 Tax=Vicia villosa TaxID=3911 RepID=UPI00273BD7E0|nr:cysteine-rich receptor-like protein kinase 44 [Vicia villosa]